MTSHAALAGRAPLPPAAEPATLTDLLGELVDGPPPPARVGLYERRLRDHRFEPLQAFLHRALGAAVSLREQGLAPGQRALVAERSPDRAWLGYLAVVMAGGVPAVHAHRPAFDDPRRGAGRLRHALGLLGPGSVVVGAGGLALEADAPPPGPAARRGLLATPAPDDLVHVQLTSGSTGPPEAVAVTHRSLLANLAALAADLGPGPRPDVRVCWLPLYHDLGLVALCLASLVDRSSLLLMSPFDFLRDPVAWLRAVARHGGTISASPNFGYEHLLRRLRPADLDGLDLGSWRVAACGGEPVRADTLRAVATALRSHGFRPEALMTAYGLAEATVYVSSSPVGRPPRRALVDRASLGGLGVVDVRDVAAVTEAGGASGGAGATGPGGDDLVEVLSAGPSRAVRSWLVDEAGCVIEGDDRCGEVVVAGPSITAGRLGAGGRLQPFDGPSLRTGDLGFRHDGELYLVERARNVVIRNGVNHSAAALELLLAPLVGARPDQVAVLDADVLAGSRLVGVVEWAAGAPTGPAVAAVEGALDRFEPPLEELVFVREGALPRTTSGKKQLAAVRDHLRTGELEVVARWELRAAPPPAVVLDAGDVVLDLTGGDGRGAGAGVDVDGGQPDVEAVTLEVLARVAEERGTLDRLSIAAHLADDLLLDSLDLVDVAVELEAALGIGLADEALGGLRTVEDLARLAAAGRVAPAASSLAEANRAFEGLPGLHAVVDEQLGRAVRVGDRWLVDLASCNYLGFDLDGDVADAIAPAVRRWGTHPSWTRAVASPAPYRELEAALAAAVGAEDTVVFPTVTLLHLGLLPALAGPGGAVLLDAAAHHSLREAAGLARARGARARAFHHQDLDDLERLLVAERGASRRVVAVDGVYSMSGECPDLRRLLELAERHDALVYVDDAHGFGLLGSGPTPGRPWGRGGGGVARHQDVAGDRLVYVSGMSKAYSTLAAFVACTPRVPRELVRTASTLVFSGPVPVASLATGLAGLEADRARGDERRERLRALTQRLLRGLDELGVPVRTNPLGLPIVTTVLGGPDAVAAGCRALWEAGVLVTPAVFPAAPLRAGGVRFTLTAANDEAHVDRALAALGEAQGPSPSVVACRPLAGARDGGLPASDALVARG